MIYIGMQYIGIALMIVGFILGFTFFFIEKQQKYNEINSAIGTNIKTISLKPFEKFLYRLIFLKDLGQKTFWFGVYLFLTGFLINKVNHYFDTLPQNEIVKVKVYVLEVQGNEYESFSKIDIKQENGVYKAKYEEEKGKFYEIEFTSDYIITEKEKTILIEEKQ